MNKRAIISSHLCRLHLYNNTQSWTEIFSNVLKYIYIYIKNHPENWFCTWITSGVNRFIYYLELMEVHWLSIKFLFSFQLFHWTKIFINHSNSDQFANESFRAIWELIPVIASKGFAREISCIFYEKSSWYKQIIKQNELISLNCLNRFMEMNQTY